MDGSLGPVLANIIMTEFGQETVKKLINQGLIAFYCKYVDGTLLLIKHSTITTISVHFHKFDPDIRFTFDLFKNSTPHFLDINFAIDGLGIYRYFYGQYSNFVSFVPYRQKTSWVRALIDRVHRICTPNKIETEFKLIRKFSSLNGLPKRIANLLIDCLTMNKQNSTPDHTTDDTPHNNQDSTIWLTIPFVGDLTTQLRRCLVDPNVDIPIKKMTTKLCFFSSTKDKKPPLSQLNVVYEFTCPGCSSLHIRNIRSRTKKALYINIYAFVIGSKIYKVLYRTFLSMRIIHFLLQ